MSEVTLTIDGLPVTVPSGTTIFDAARLNGIAIPTLCHQQNETPVGVCRVCLVEAGGRVLHIDLRRRSPHLPMARLPALDPTARTRRPECVVAVPSP